MVGTLPVTVLAFPIPGRREELLVNSQPLPAHLLSHLFYLAAMHMLCNGYKIVVRRCKTTVEVRPSATPVREAVVALHRTTEDATMHKENP